MVFCAMSEIGTRKTGPFVTTFNLARAWLRLLEGLSALEAWLVPQRRARKRMKAHFAHIVELARIDAAVASQGTHGQIPVLISFLVPTYNTLPKYLDDLLYSFHRQTGPRCELVLSDDGSTAAPTARWLDEHTGQDRIVVVRSAQNKGIAHATNAGIQAASGRWVGLLDHDDALAPYAVERIARALANAPGCQFLYTDEIVTDGDLRPVDYFLKPAWDRVFLSGVNYINHLSLYRRDRLLALGGLRVEFDGSQDYDLVLRYTRDLPSSDILHLPYPAYLWRRHRDAFSARFIENATRYARQALSESFGMEGRAATVDVALTTDLHRVRFDTDCTSWPLVSVVIPSRNALPLISKVLEGLTTQTDYPSLEIIVIDNGTTDPEVFALYARYRNGTIPFRADVEPEPFNFSRSVNKGIARANGSHILLLNNDIEILEPGWLKEMVSCFSYDGVGIVGAKLLYPNGTLQHAGVIAGLSDLAGHWFVGEPDDCPGPMGRLWVRQSLSVVTGACMLISRACLDRIGPFDEQVFPVAYNDVDFCLRAVKLGSRIVWTPFAKLVHHESASRGSDETPHNVARFRRDQHNLRERHGTDAYEDRAFNPWYSRSHSVPQPIFRDTLPDARS